MVAKMDTTNIKTAPGANRAALNTDFDKSDRASANNQAQSTNDLLIEADRQAGSIPCILTRERKVETISRQLCFWLLWLISTSEDRAV
jgi:hypothetical protein